MIEKIIFRYFTCLFILGGSFTVYVFYSILLFTFRSYPLNPFPLPLLSLNYFGAMLPKFNEGELVLTDAHGLIDCASRAISEILQLNPRIISRYKINICMLCKKIYKILEAFNK